MARGLRIGIVALIAAFELAALITSLATYRRPAAEYGYNLGFDGRTVIAIEPGFGADRAGLRPGDTIDYAKLSVPGRINAILNEMVAPGTRLDVTFTRQNVTRSVTLVAVTLPWLYGMVNLSYALAGLVLGAVSLGLLVLRPNRMTWGFALVAPPLLLPDALSQWSQTAPHGLGFTYETFSGLLYALQAAGIVTFASRFPTQTPTGINRTIDRLAIPLGVALGIVYVCVNWSIWFSASPPLPLALAIQDYVAPVLPSIAALLALVTTFITTDRGIRSRLTPTLFAYLLFVVIGAAQTGTSFTSSPAVLLFLYFAFSLAAVLVALAVAYAVVRHRVIDVGFIVGRTLAYSILTVFAVSVFTLIEFFVGKILEHNGLATILEIAAALALGLSLNALHGRLDKFIDRVLFRRRHLAEVRLEHAAGSLPHATSPALVADLLVEEPADALDLGSATVFVLAGDRRRYVREHARGWDAGDATELDFDDHLVVRLRADLSAVHLETFRWPRAGLPTGIRQPVYAVPVAVGNQLEAIALYGAHASGEDLDPDERRSLRVLARNAALAYDHLRVQALRKSLEQARVENAAIARVEQTLRSLLERRLSDPGSQT